MGTIVITSLKSAETKSLQAYLSAQGYRVVTPPDGCRLWKEEEVRAHE